MICVDVGNLAFNSNGAAGIGSKDPVPREVEVELPISAGEKRLELWRPIEDDHLRPWLLWLRGKESFAPEGEYGVRRRFISAAGATPGLIKTSAEGVVRPN